MSKFVKRPASSSKNYALTEMRPSPRAGHSVVVVDDQTTTTVGVQRYMFVVGGYAKSGPLADVFRFDIKVSKWERVTAPPATRSPTTAASKKATTSTAKATPSPLPRLEFDCCCVGSDIYLFGGIQLDDFDNVLIYNDLWSFDTKKMRWSVLDEGSSVSERSSHSCTAVAGGGLIVYGGECMSAALPDSWLWHVEGRRWQRVGNREGPQPEPRSAHAACYIAESSALVIFGGITSVNGEIEHLNDLWCLDTAGGTAAADQWAWRSIVFQTGLAPSPRDLPMMLAARGGVLIMGGYGLEEKEEEDDDEEEEEALLVVQMDTVSLNNTHTEESDKNESDVVDVDSKTGGEDEEGSEVGLGYLCDAFFVDVAAASSRELACEDDALSRGSRYGPARRGARAVLLRGAHDEVLTFGGYDGEGFVGLTEILDLELLLLEPQPAVVAADLAIE